MTRSEHEAERSWMLSDWSLRDIFGDGTSIVQKWRVTKGIRLSAAGYAAIAEMERRQGVPPSFIDGPGYWLLRLGPSIQLLDCKTCRRVQSDQGKVEARYCDGCRRFLGDSHPG
jgi:hypothetical protein